MYRFLFRFSVIILTILTANLVTTAISNYVISFRNQYDPLRFTLIGMTIIVVIFYPLFTKIEDWIKSLSGKVMRSGNSFAGKYLGLPLMFFVAMLVLFHFYAKMWYHINFLHLLLQYLRNFLSSLL